MPRIPRVKSKSGIYHIILRGANKQEIFHDEEDNKKFLEILKKYKTECGLNIFAWCSMNNHVHLLLKEGTEDISLTMKRIGVSYVRFYNWKYQTIGHLFQDRFKSINVESLNSLLSVMRYIHQNPVKAGTVKLCEEWKWSSFKGYFDKKEKLIDKVFVLNFFSENPDIALKYFKEFHDRYYPEAASTGLEGRALLSDEEARQAIKEAIGSVNLAQVKSLPKSYRDSILVKIKRIEGLTQRQAARILGISPNIIFKVKK